MRHVRVAQHERDIPPRRRLRYEAQRHTVERRHGAAEQRRIRAQVLSDGADDRHLALAARLREVAQIIQNRIQPPCVVDGDATPYRMVLEAVERRDDDVLWLRYRVA